mgnify:CR=1 FL=1
MFSCGLQKTGHQLLYMQRVSEIVYFWKRFQMFWISFLFAGMNKKQLEAEYKNRIFRATDYIESHIDHAFTLEELSGVAAFSKFHFNRIFKALIGESPFQYIQRIRLEKCAANMLSNPNDSISEIAFKWGFQDMSVFSRYFKNYFGVTASEFKKQKSNIGQSESNMHQAECTNTGYFCIDKPVKQRRKTQKNNI